MFDDHRGLEMRKGSWSKTNYRDPREQHKGTLMTGSVHADASSAPPQPSTPHEDPARRHLPLSPALGFGSRSTCSTPEHVCMHQLWLQYHSRHAKRLRACDIILVTGRLQVAA
ncbi:uncharacterized protein LOC112560906 [Pomacea canaliculata]|uniref:uncharacterized protein LOC112560906 n=1 Tax=Pomacea canaliculata TaxID=400727 RepID=UPI000D733A58|nr:uncharacterized protein LOC112560906 [Pomacea canaliculata]